MKYGNLPRCVLVQYCSKRNVKLVLNDIFFIIKRNYLQPGKKKLEELDKLLEEIHFKNVDSSTIQIVANEDILSGCRTLDALHLSTAIEFRKEFGDSLVIFSYNKDFNKVAKELKFKTL